jgi:DNA-binding IscR family transcriptional regulator
LFALSGAAVGGTLGADGRGQQTDAGLAKIFQPLAEAGVIEGQRGKKGGIRLVKKDANLAYLLQLLEPKFAFNKCLSGGYRCFRQSDCQLHTLLYKMQHDFFARLGRLKLSGIVA